MADEQYRWLDRGTAERLLGGESTEAVDPADREQAERLASTLGALPGPPPSADGELPGEAAALATFRAVREERAERAARDDAGGPAGIKAPPADPSGAGHGPHRGRPARFGLALALIVGMAGSTAALAGIGVLRAPSGAPGPSATSTSAVITPSEIPLRSTPSREDRPGGTAPGNGGPDKPSEGADHDTGQPHGPGTDGEEDGSAPEPGVKTGDLAAGKGKGRGKQIASACRALRDGRKLTGSRKRLVEDEAGGPSKVGPYCENVLAAHGTGTGADADSVPGAV